MELINDSGPRRRRRAVEHGGVHRYRRNAASQSSMVRSSLAIFSDTTANLYLVAFSNWLRNEVIATMFSWTCSRRHGCVWWCGGAAVRWCGGVVVWRRGSEMEWRFAERVRRQRRVETYLLHGVPVLPIFLYAAGVVVARSPRQPSHLRQAVRHRPRNERQAARESDGRHRRRTRARILELL